MDLFKQMVSFRKQNPNFRKETTLFEYAGAKTLGTVLVVGTNQIKYHKSPPVGAQKTMLLL
jgi:hypothetical protein